MIRGKLQELNELTEEREKERKNKQSIYLFVLGLEESVFKSMAVVMVRTIHKAIDWFNDNNEIIWSRLLCTLNQTNIRSNDTGSMLLVTVTTVAVVGVNVFFLMEDKKKDIQNLKCGKMCNHKFFFSIWSVT